MKKLIFIAAIAAMLTGCSSMESDELMNQSVSKSVKSEFSISEQEALKIASEAFGGTRAVSTMKADAIVNNDGTRSLPDTAAYVINVGNDEGFVIVSADSRMERILAFSDESGLDMSDTDHPVFDQFINRIPAYKAHVIESYDPATLEDEYDPGLVDRYEYYVGPLLHGGKWDLRDPFNKYIPNRASPGCAAVAVGQIMMHCRDTLTYAGRTYDCPQILSAMRDSVVVAFPPIQPPIIIGQGAPDAKPNVIVNPGTGLMTYYAASDAVAHLLSDLGTELHMTYGNAEDADSFTAAVFAQSAFINNGFNVYQTLRSYHADTMLDCLANHDCYLYVEGYAYTDANCSNFYRSFVWIIDGCRFNGQWDMSINGLRVYDLQFHCDWGLRGRANGYYSTSVFEAHAYNNTYYLPTSLMTFMGIKR